jgi:hypothetical protein
MNAMTELATPAMNNFLPTVGAETSATAAATQARAMVEARYVMAIKRPRNWDQVRLDVVKECRRPSFAHNKSAFYRKPIGDGVEGLGIRFVEVAFRCMTNVLTETTMIFEDDSKEVYRVSVTDLEANVTYPLDVRVTKTVERSKPLDDGSFISVRKNSWNKNVYTIPGTDDELLNKRAAMISKAIRTLGLRIIPGDLQDEAEYIIKQVRLDKAAKDPDAERIQITDAFTEIGVSAINLADYLGHPLAQCSPAQLVELRGIYGAIRDGEATWKAVMDNKAQGEGGSTPPPPPAPPAPPRKTAATQTPPAPPTQPPEPPPVDADGMAIDEAAAETGSGTSTRPLNPPAAQPGVFMATGGEKQNIISRARTQNMALALLLENLGPDHGVNPENLDGLTKEGFKLLKAVLS